MINLWTLHSEDFSITDGCIDHNKSEYYNKTKGVKDAYPELWRRLSEIVTKEFKTQVEKGQIIWCFTDKDIIDIENDVDHNGNRKRLWSLEVPENKVLAYIDSSVWSRIINNGKCEVPDDLRLKWRVEAPRKFPFNSKKQKEYMENCKDEFLNQKPLSGSWWDELFVDINREKADALILHPVSDDYVVYE